jgi:dephospho-CoA kinase
MNQQPDIFTAALTGGIASGKSTVARMFSGHGANLIDTDHIARQVVEPGSAGLKAVIKAFGPKYLGADGGLNRGALRNLVFDDAEARGTLNSILHPLIRAEVARRLRELSREDPKGVALVDVPLLFETGWYKKYPVIVLVYVPPLVQISRLMARDGITREQAQKALAAQLPIDEKRTKARFLVDNSGSLEETQREVAVTWRLLRKMSIEQSGG